MAILGHPFSGHYILLAFISELFNRIDVFCNRKGRHYIRMATINVATKSGVRCSITIGISSVGVFLNLTGDMWAPLSRAPVWGPIEEM